MCNLPFSPACAVKIAADISKVYNREIMQRMEPIVIVGAGISGLTIGYELARNGRKVIIIEKESQIGGLAKSFQYRDFVFDIGPHRFFSQDQQILQFIQNLLKEDFTEISRFSGVYFYGKYYNWPLQPNLLFRLPFNIAIKSIWDLFIIGLKNNKEKVYNFEDYVLKNYGPTLYNTFFRDYTQKFLGILAQETHFEWAQIGMEKAVINEKMASRNIVDIVKLTFKSIPFPKVKFIYPAKGIGSFCEKLAKEIIKYKGEIRINKNITDFKNIDGRIEKIVLDGEEICIDKIIWTASLKTLCNLLKLSSCGLNYLSLILYNIEIDKPLKQGYQWCYYGSKDIIFSRVTVPSLFNAHMAPKDKFGLCVEVACREGDLKWREPESFIEKIKNDLLKVKLVEHLEDIKGIHVERVRDTYPIYKLNFPKELEIVKRELSQYENLILAGRTGLFWYNNMDESILNGFETAKHILQGPAYKLYVL